MGVACIVYIVSTLLEALMGPPSTGRITQVLQQTHVLPARLLLPAEATYSPGPFQPPSVFPVPCQAACQMGCHDQLLPA